jgi:hypothetical protein
VKIHAFSTSSVLEYRRSVFAARRVQKLVHADPRSRRGRFGSLVESVGEGRLL